MINWTRIWQIWKSLRVSDIILFTKTFRYLAVTSQIQGTECFFLFFYLTYNFFLWSKILLCLGTFSPFFEYCKLQFNIYYMMRLIIRNGGNNVLKRTLFFFFICTNEVNPQCSKNLHGASMQVEMMNLFTHSNVCRDYFPNVCKSQSYLQSQSYLWKWCIFSS